MSNQTVTETFQALDTSSEELETWKRQRQLSVDPTFKFFDAAMTIKDQALTALKSRWPEEIAVYIDGLIQQAPNILYIAQNSHDYFVPPDNKLSLNWWIETFSPKTEGRMALLATTDRGLFDLLQKHGKVSKGAYKEGVIMVGFTEIIASGGYKEGEKGKKFVTVATVSALFQAVYPLTNRLTRLIHSDTIEPAHIEGMKKYGLICYHILCTAYYHMSHQWPVWVGTQPHRTGPIAVFGINPSLGNAASADALLQALRSSKE